MKKFRDIRVLEYLPLIFFIGYFFFVLSGRSTGWTAHAYDEWRLLQVVVICLMPVFYLRRITFFPFKKALPLFSLLFVSAFLGAEDQYWSIFRLTFFLLVFLFFFCAVKVFLKGEENKKYFFASISVLFVPILLGMMLSIIATPFIEKFIFDIFLFGNVRYYDDFALPCFFMIFFLLEKKVFPKLRLFFVVICFLIFLSFWLHGARGVLLSLAVTMMFLFFIDSDRRGLIVFLVRLFALSFLTFLLVKGWVYIFAASDGSHPLVRTTSSGRLDLWMHGIRAWVNKPFFGIGVGHYASLGPAPSSVIDGGTIHFMQMHNFPLQLVVELGLAGFICLYVAFSFYKKSILYKNVVPLSALAGVLSVGLYSFLSGILIYPHTQVASVIVLAWAASYLPEEENKQKNTIIAQLLFVVCVGFVAWYVWNDFWRVGCTSERPLGFARPDFWQYGYYKTLVCRMF